MQSFIVFALEKKVLQFGDFTTKSGRKSPYFFNTGLFNDGSSLLRLGEFYSEALLRQNIAFDMLFGSAYKGIPLVSSVAIALARRGHNVPYAYNRKEAKDHGEGGVVVGAPLSGKVMIVDDVLSAGISANEAINMIREKGATPCGVLLALDRQEKDVDRDLFATQAIQETHHIPVVSLITLDKIIAYLEEVDDQNLVRYKSALVQYRERYGKIPT